MAELSTYLHQITYNAGETIRGGVRVVFKKPEKIRGVKVSFTGGASTEYSTDVTKTFTNSSGETESRTQTVRYYGSENYINAAWYVFGDRNQLHEMEPGTYEYSFEYTLPSDIPSSFSGAYGDISYSYSGVLERPGFKFNSSVEYAFIVISPVDLNWNPNYRNPRGLEWEVYFCCWRCKNGPLHCKISIPRNGYVRGEHIPITCEIDNRSKVVVKKVLVELELYSGFTMTNPYEYQESYNTVSSVSFGRTEKGESSTSTEFLYIPSECALEITNCGIIRTSYTLEAVVKTKGCHLNLDSSMNITLGTIPLKE